MSVSGLNHAHASHARELAVRAAVLGLNHAPSVHYTQGPERWEGISHNLKAWRGEYPHHADCSAFVAWCIWNGLHHYGVRDTVNGADWRYGYTGSMVEKMVRVRGPRNRADAVVYGDPRGGSGHTALVVGHRNRKLMVISFGSEAGPFYLPWDYRSDIYGVFRAI